MRASAGAWLLAARPVAAVLAVDPSGLAPFGPLKWGLVSALVLAAGSVLCGRARPPVLARRPVWAWLGFLLVVVATAVFGLDPLYAWIGTPERHFGALTWLLCAITFLAGQQVPEREGRLVAMAAGAALLGTSGWAMAEELGWEPIRLSGAGDRPVATLGSSAYLGAVPPCSSRRRRAWPSIGDRRRVFGGRCSPPLPERHHLGGALGHRAGRWAGGQRAAGGRGGRAGHRHRRPEGEGRGPAQAGRARCHPDLRLRARYPPAPWPAPRGGAASRRCGSG